MTDVDDRTEEEIQEVLKVLFQITFFKERKIKEEDLRDIINYFQIEEGVPGQEVISYGSKGQKFYLIL